NSSTSAVKGSSLPMTSFRDEEKVESKEKAAPLLVQAHRPHRVSSCDAGGTDNLTEAKLQAELNEIMVSILRSNSIIRKLLLRKRGLRLKAQLEIVRKRIH